MVKAALLVLGGFAAGLGMGLFLQPAGEFRQVEVSGGAAESAPTVEELAAPPPTEAETPALVGVVKAGGRALAEALAVPLPAVEKGEGAIAGHVRTDSGEPLAGVLVRANRIPESRQGPWRAPQGADEPSLEERLREVVEEEGWRQANRREARSGEDGSFLLSGLVQASYWIEAFREGFTIAIDDRRRHGSVRPGDKLELVGRAVLEVPIAVLMPDGSQAAAATIRVQGAARRRHGSLRSELQWSPEDPRIELSPGTHLLTAVHGAHGELASPDEEVTVEAGAPVPGVTLQLRRRPGIQGRVLLDESDPFRFTEVRLMRILPANPPDMKRLCEQGTSRGSHFESGSESGSSFAFTDLLPGTYLLGVSRGHGGRILATEVVDVADQMVTRDLALPPPARSDYLVLRVYGPAGEILADAEISTGLTTKGGGSSSGSGGEVRQGDGSAWVLHREWCGRDESDEAVNTVTVRDERYPPKTVEYKRSEASEVTVQFSEPAFLDVSLVGFTPEAYEGTFRLDIEQEKEETSGEAVGDEGRRLRRRRFSRHGFDGEGGEPRAGRGHFGPLEPGPYVVVLSYGARQHANTPVQTLPVTLRPGKNAASMPVPRLFSLRIRVDGAARNSRIHLEPARPGESASWQLGDSAGADGLTVFDGLPAGDYKVSFYGDGEESGDMLVSVPAQTEVRFQARKLNAMLVTVGDAESALAKAGFQTGDLIVGVNGAGFEGRRGWWELFRKLPEDREARFQVERGNELLEIPLSPRALHQGGRLDPAGR